MEPLPDLEIESLDLLKQHLHSRQSVSGTVLQGLDLCDPDIEAMLATRSFEGCYLLGCRLSDSLREQVRRTGGVIFPMFKDLPFDPYRSRLYTVAELLEGYERGRPDSIQETTDARIFSYFKRHKSESRRAPILEALACRIHDHAIDNALRDVIDPATRPAPRIVGIMGGHKLGRDHPGFRGVAGIARRLTREGYFIATGGGPGAMEAGNLGAWMAERDELSLEACVELLEPDPTFLDPHYIDRAFGVLDRFPTGLPSLAVPTWFYGHEPSNLFSTYIAKYFANSIREDGLLAIATYGVVFSPGSAGTIQEIFQDAAQNHYGSVSVVSPMVFLGVDYWTRVKPVHELLLAMSEGKPYRSLIHITDSPDDAVDFIMRNPPVRAE